MMEAGVPLRDDKTIEDALHDALMRGDAAISSASTVLRLLLDNENRVLFTDEIVARTRGMINDLARQLLQASTRFGHARKPFAWGSEQTQKLIKNLIADNVLLDHVHAMALEFHLSMELQECHALDPALSPLLQAQAGSGDHDAAGNVMQLVAAQTQFHQQTRRMELPLDELPPGLFDRALQILRVDSEDDPDSFHEIAEHLRSNRDSGHSRLALLVRQLAQLDNASVALVLPMAGVSLFFTALAGVTRQDRSALVLAANERRAVRFILSLRAAGLEPGAIADVLAWLSPDVALPDCFQSLGVDDAWGVLEETFADVMEGG